ncbi:hypothetical protein ACQKWADRAFT_119215 [Trichoderma austrokoningii]
MRHAMLPKKGKDSEGDDVAVMNESVLFCYIHSSLIWCVCGIEDGIWVLVEVDWRTNYIFVLLFFFLWVLLSLDGSRVLRTGE